MSLYPWWGRAALSRVMAGDPLSQVADAYGLAELELADCVHEANADWVFTPYRHAINELINEALRFSQDSLTVSQDREEQG